MPRGTTLKQALTAYDEMVSRRTESEDQFSFVPQFRDELSTSWQYAPTAICRPASFKDNKKVVEVHGLWKLSLAKILVEIDRKSPRVACSRELSPLRALARNFFRWILAINTYFNTYTRFFRPAHTYLYTYIGAAGRRHTYISDYQKSMRPSPIARVPITLAAETAISD